VHYLLHSLHCNYYIARLNLVYMRFLLLLLLALFFVTPSYSQNKINLVGTVSDSSGKKPVEFAAVALFSPKDSSIVASAVSDMLGSFELRNITPGRYILKVSHMSFRTSSKRFTARSSLGLFSIGDIKLAKKEIALAEVVVMGKSRPIRIAKDTVEYNAVAYKPRQQDVVADVLKKLPGVVLGSDGAITINGKTVTQIMVDGKKFFLNDPALAVQNLPADIVDRIQVVNKKSDQAEFSKIDDGKTEKVINLTLKKDKKRGVFGSYRAGVGADGKYDLGVRLGGFKGATQLLALGGLNNINRQGSGGGTNFPNANRPGVLTSGSGAITLNYEPSKRLAANGSYSYGYSNSKKETTNTRQNFDKQGVYGSDGFSSSDADNRSHALTSRIEYKLDTTLSATISPNVQYSNGVSQEMGNSHLFDHVGALVNSEERESSRTTESYSCGLDILLKKRFKQPRQTLSVDLDTRVGSSNSSSFTNQKNYYAVKDFTNLRNQHVAADGENSSLASRIVYTYPMGRCLTMEVNHQFRYGYSQSKNAAFDFNAATNEYNLENSQYSKNYRNGSYKNAAGLQLSFSNGKLVANAGFDGNVMSQEYRNQIGSQWLDTSLVFRNIAPSMMVSYSHNDATDFNFNYYGNTRQPTVEQLHPVQNPNTPNTILIANPFLNQEFIHNFSLGFIYFNKVTFVSFNSSLVYSITNNAIVGQSYRDELGRWYQKSVNVKGGYSLSSYTTIGKSVLGNKLHLSATTSLDYSQMPGFISQIKYFTNQLTGGENIKSYLTLDYFELGAEVGYSFNSVRYKGLADNMAEAQSSKTYSTLDVSSSLTAFLPVGFEVKSTVEASRKYGDMATGSDDTFLWNAALTKKFLSDKSLALSVMAFDILNRNKPFSRNITSNYIEDVRFTAVSQLFMVTLSYTLNQFSGTKV